MGGSNRFCYRPPSTSLEGKMIDEEFPAPYNNNFGDEEVCKCGHPYYRHFDSYEDMHPVGCKYCECYIFESKDGRKLVKHTQDDDFAKGYDQAVWEIIDEIQKIHGPERAIASYLKTIFGESYEKHKRRIARSNSKKKM